MSSSIHYSSSPFKSKFSMDNAFASGLACVHSRLTSNFVVQGGTDKEAAEHQKFEK